MLYIIRRGRDLRIAGAECVYSCEQDSNALAWIVNDY